MAKKFSKTLIWTAILGAAVVGGITYYQNYKKSLTDDDFDDFDDDLENDYSPKEPDASSREYVSLNNHPQDTVSEEDTTSDDTASDSEAAKLDTEEAVAAEMEAVAETETE